MHGNQDDAMEVVQQASCQVFERLEPCRSDASLHGWMGQLYRNHIADTEYRRRRELAASH